MTIADQYPDALNIGEDLWIVQVEPGTLNEQDINAQVMDPRDFDQLVDNITQRGQLESLPYCWQKPGTTRIEIISGHHRVRAAVAAGLPRIPILLDNAEMTRSTLVAKQIAHNQLSGRHDDATLRILVDMITDLDDLVASGLPDDYLPTADSTNIPLLAPKAEFDWRTVTLTFLPERMTEFEDALISIDRHSALIGVANSDQFQDFSAAVIRYMGAANIKNISTAISELTRTAKAEATRLEAEAEADAQS